MNPDDTGGPSTRAGKRQSTPRAAHDPRRVGQNAARHPFFQLGKRKKLQDVNPDDAGDPSTRAGKPKSTPRAAYDPALRWVSKLFHWSVHQTRVGLSCPLSCCHHSRHSDAIPSPSPNFFDSSKAAEAILSNNSQNSSRSIVSIKLGSLFLMKFKL